MLQETLKQSVNAQGTITTNAYGRNERVRDVHLLGSSYTQQILWRQTPCKHASNIHASYLHVYSILQSGRQTWPHQGPGAGSKHTRSKNLMSTPESARTISRSPMRTPVEAGETLRVRDWRCVHRFFNHAGSSDWSWMNITGESARTAGPGWPTYPLRTALVKLSTPPFFCKTANS